MFEEIKDRVNQQITEQIASINFKNKMKEVLDAKELMKRQKKVYKTITIEEAFMKNPTMQTLKTLPFNHEKFKNQRKFQPVSPDEADHDDNYIDLNNLTVKTPQESHDHNGGHGHAEQPPV